MSFDSTSETDKAELYTVLVKVGRLNGHRALAALNLPFPKGWALTDASLSNLRKGQYDQHRAQIMYDWLMQNHFQEAHEASERLFPETPDQRLSRLVEEHAVEGKLRIVTAEGQLSLVEHRSKRKEGIPTIKAGQEFWFELDVEEDGYVVAFQGYHGKWTQFALVDGLELVADIETGTNELPCSTLGGKDELVEQSNLGCNHFVFIYWEASTIRSASANLVSVTTGRESSCAIVSVRVV